MAKGTMIIGMAAGLRDAIYDFAERARAISTDPLNGKALRGGGFRLRAFLAGIGQENATGKHPAINSASEAQSAFMQLAEAAGKARSEETDPAMKARLAALRTTCIGAAARYQLLGSFGFKAEKKPSKPKTKTPKPTTEEGTQATA